MEQTWYAKTLGFQNQIFDKKSDKNYPMPPMPTESLDSAGKPYRSKVPHLLNVIQTLTGFTQEALRISERTEVVRAREIIAILMYEGMGWHDSYIGNTLGKRTPAGIKARRKHGVKRLITDEEFAHLFATAEIRSNIYKDR